MYKLGLEKAEESEIKLPAFNGLQRKQGNSVSLTTLKRLTVWITTNCEIFLKKWEYQTILPVSWEICMQVKKQQLEPDMEQWTGCKLGKEYIKAAYCHLAYLTYMHSTACEMPGWVIHKLESRFLEEISTTSDMQISLMENEEKLKSLMMRMKE